MFANMETLLPLKIETSIGADHVRLARLAKALSHPVRVFVLEFLSRRACCYSGDLSDLLPIAKSTLSQHLRELKDAGLIQGELEAPKVRYCLRRDNWEQARALFGDFLGLEA